MTTPLNMTSQEIPPKDRSAPRSQRTWLWLMTKSGFAALAIGTVLMLLWSSSSEPTAAVPKTEPSQNAAVVQLVGPRLIAVQAGSLLEKKLAIVPASREQITTPVLTVTGSVVARLRAGSEPAEDRWQFSSPELLTTYADWQKARTEVDFAEKQLSKTRELTAVQLTAQTKVVERLRKLVAAGTEAIKDLAAEEAKLLQTQLEGQKAVFEAEAAVRVAARNRAALERQLFQTGVDPHLLERATEGATIVMADVPEARVGLVAAEQACEARFYGLPDMVFPGKVSSLAPTLSGERRTLRVFFELNDQHGRLKPGMYAEIGLGTDPRQTVLLPADVLLDLSRRTVALLRRVPGAVDVSIEQEGPQPQLVIQPDRALCARYNVRIEDVTRLINIALGGEPVGTLYEGERRFDIVAKFAREHLRSPQAIGRLPVHNAEGIPIPLSQVAKIEVVDGQTIIAREEGRRRLTVRCDIVGRDQGGFVAEAQRLFEKEMAVPNGYRVSWLGMFENLARARQHFQILVPVTIAVIYILLLTTFGSQRAAVLLLLAIPFAFIGGAIAVLVRGMNLNVSTGVGFAAVFGVSIMNGVLMVRTITALRLQGTALEEAIIQGAVRCLRPIAVASLVAILGLVPASLATGLGSDVQRPLATVIVWGLFSSTTLTLFVVPTFYRIFVPALPAPEMEEEDELAVSSGSVQPEARA